MPDIFGRPICYAFIDSQNLNLAIQDCGWDLDFKRFRAYLKDKYRIEKAYLFIGYVPGNEALYKDLQEAGYILIFKPTLSIKKGTEGVIKGNIDAELVLHCMIQFFYFDKAMIVSGDGDFHCLIEYLHTQGKLLSVLIPNPNKFSALLRKYRPYFVMINRMQQKLGRRSAENTKRGSSLRTEP